MGIAKLVGETRRRRLLALGAAVLVLAAVIIVGSALSAPRGAIDDGGAEQPSAREQSERLALDAQDLLSQDETTTALMLAERALALDSGNQTARRVVTAVSAQSGTSSPAKGSGGAVAAPTDQPAAGKQPGNPKPGADPYAVKVTDSAVLVPSTFLDWKRGREVAVGTGTQVTFEPTLESNDARLAVRALVYAHELGTVAAAQGFVSNVSRVAYPERGRNVTVGDGFTGYIGSKDRQVVVSFARGQYAFEAAITGQPGASFDDLAPLALRLAETLPSAAN